MEWFRAAAPVGAGEDLAVDIDRWSGSAALRALVAEFDGAGNLFAADLDTRLARLDTFSERWDTRRGLERNLARQTALRPDQDALVLAAADALGMVRPRGPQREAYDHVLVLGGLVRACIVRPAYAAELIRSRALRTPTVSALGGHRPFRGDEDELAAAVGLVGVDDEFGALDAGMRRAFDLGEPREVQGQGSDLVGGAWSLRRYTLDPAMTVFVAAAPSSHPAQRRANTADTFAWFADNVVSLQAGQSVLAVTTAIYIPAQQAAAIRMLALPFGVHVETIGGVPTDLPQPLAQTFTAAHYLQEIRSAIRGYRALLDAIPR